MTNVNLVVMLTYNDVTVKNAYEVFNTCKNLPVQHWGFKNVGLEKAEMKRLVEYMKENEKTTYLEVVTYDEQSCMEAAKLAVEIGFDALMGTVYYPDVHAYLNEHQMSYSPFVGRVSGSPSILEGSFEEIVEEAKKLMSRGIQAFDLLAYRHVVDGEGLAQYFCEHINAKICIAGSINSFDRIDIMNRIQPWGFTMGSALFDRKFVPDGDFYSNLKAVTEYMEVM